MSTRQRIVADLLFGIQLTCTVIFGGSQFLRMLSTAQGVSISWFISWELFLILNLMLVVRAHRVQPSRVTRQTIASYAAWTMMISADIAVMLVKHTGSWKYTDTLTSAFVIIGVVTTLLIAYRHHLTITDPMIKGYLAIFCKAVPQIMLAVSMWQLGGAGLAGAAVVTGHVTILTRLGQLGFSIREAGWDRNRVGSAISEIANECSWVIATIVWLTVK